MNVWHPFMPQIQVKVKKKKTIEMQKNICTPALFGAVSCEIMATKIWQK